MRIAIIHHSDDITNDYGAYLAALLDETAKAKDYLIKDYDHVVNAKEKIASPNVLLHIVIPAVSKFSLKYWYNYKLLRIFKKYTIDTAICLYGICASSSQVKQLLVIPDIALLTPGKGLLWQRFAAVRLKENMRITHAIFTYSHTAARALTAFASDFTQKINVLSYAAPELFVPMEWHNKLYVKSRYAQNKEYFIAILPDDNEMIFVDLLKAYSKFKKWQQSGMKLVLLPKEESFSGSIDKKLEKYKYREDVNLVNDADKKDTADLVAAAYVMLHPALDDADLWPVVLGLQCSVPLITYPKNSIREYTGEAAVYVDEKDPEAFGDELIRLYKDEAAKTTMTEAAIVQTANYKQPDVIEQLWLLLTQQQ